MKRFLIQYHGQALVRARSLPRDEGGSISIMSVVFVIFFAMVLGMVMNIGRHADRKVIMQNGSDAATWTGGVVLSRSMNTLAFTNHLLCDVFALTAYLREARDRNAELQAEDALDAWNEVAPDFSNAPVAKFSQLAGAIPGQAALEQNLIDVWSDQNAAVSAQLLPVLEMILDEEMIPEFQRALHEATPRLATEAACEVAVRHGPEDAGLADGAPMCCFMWRTDGEPFDGEGEWFRSTLPVADPVWDRTEFQPRYMQDGLEQRRDLSYFYLARLNSEMLVDFDRIAKMSQFSVFWRGFTRGYLEELLAEYPDTNIPYQIRDSVNREFDPNTWLHDEYMFVGVAYWASMEERLPGLFRNPMDADDQAFTQIRLFIPRNRLLYDPTRPPEYQIFRQNHPSHRDLINQGWTTQIVPATSSSIPSILESVPPNDETFVPANLGGISVEEFRRINTH